MFMNRRAIEEEKIEDSGRGWARMALPSLMSNRNNFSSYTCICGWQKNSYSHHWFRPVLGMASSRSIGLHRRLRCHYKPESGWWSRTWRQKRRSRRDNNGKTGWNEAFRSVSQSSELGIRWWVVGVCLLPELSCGKLEYGTSACFLAVKVGLFTFRS